MANNCSSTRCSHCGGELPQGVRVALFSSPDAEVPVLGDFCCVAHAFGAIEALPRPDLLPETLVLGVRVERAGHDPVALATIMAEMVRRAVRAALTEPDQVGAEELPAPHVPPSQLN